MSVVEVAPAIVLNVLPPLVLTSHCTVGVGEPVAAAIKPTDWPALTATLLGLAVTTGRAWTTSVAAVVVAVPMPLENTARYRLPDWATAVTKLYVADVAPGMVV